MSRVEDLFGDPDYLRKLSHLDLVAKQIFAGVRRGERRGGRRGTGTLFADYRSYSRGDDLRYVDWNVYGRLGTLFVKEFEVEESANVLIILDRSGSMAFGEPTKLDFARRVAAAIGYIALAHLDRVEILPLPGGEPRAFSGKAQAPAFFEHLLDIRAEGETDLAASLRVGLAAQRRGGLAILLSDLYDRQGFQHAVDLLIARRHRVFLVQVTALEEEEPRLAGAFRLTDAETGRRIDVRADPRLLDAYEDRWRGFCRRVDRYAVGKEIGHARLRSDADFSQAVLTLLRRGGVIR